MTEKKKRFTFADAKLRIKELEEKINVDLSDNVVTTEELRTLRVYKAGFFVAVAILIVAGLFLLF